MDELDELLKTDRDFSIMSVTQGAPAAFKHYLVEGAIMLPNNALPQLGIDRIYQAMAGDYTMRWSPEAGQVSKSGDLGYTWGHYVSEFMGDGGKKIVEKGKYLNIWAKQKDGTWRVKVDMGNST
jgi:ketosteroid isomerase-like protein